MVCCVLLQNVTLLELMDEDDIVQECKSQNRRLVDLLVFYCYFKCAYYNFTGLLLYCAKLFLSELLQISTNFDNFWKKDGKEAKIMQGALIFHLT